MEDYCQPRKHVPFSRYLLHQQQQQIGESYEKYKIELRMLAQTCEFKNITSEETLRYRLVFEIRNGQVRE